MTTATVDCLCVDVNVTGRLARIKGEFLEMPGLRLTLAQAQRLWGLDRDVCRCLLDRLVDSRFLQRKADETYGLVSSDWSQITGRNPY
jgi:hypothetical protein